MVWINGLSRDKMHDYHLQTRTQRVFKYLCSEGVPLLFDEGDNFQPNTWNSFMRILRCIANWTGNPVNRETLTERLLNIFQDQQVEQINMDINDICRNIDVPGDDFYGRFDGFAQGANHINGQDGEQVARAIKILLDTNRNPITQLDKFITTIEHPRPQHIHGWGVPRMSEYAHLLRPDIFPIINNGINEIERMQAVHHGVNQQRRYLFFTGIIKNQLESAEPEPFPQDYLLLDIYLRGDGLNHNGNRLRNQLLELINTIEVTDDYLNAADANPHPLDNEYEYEYETEGAKFLSQHISYERNATNRQIFLQSLTRTSCAVCNINLYNIHNLGLILEVHHKQPLGNDQPAQPDHNSFEAVCPNCHTVLHKLLNNINDINQLSGECFVNKHQSFVELIRSNITKVTNRNDFGLFSIEKDQQQHTKRSKQKNTSTARSTKNRKSKKKSNVR